MPPSAVQGRLGVRDNRSEVTQVSLEGGPFPSLGGKKVNTRGQKERVGGSGRAEAGGRGAARRCAKVPLGHSGAGATRRRTGVCPLAGPGYKEAPRRAEFPGGVGSLLGLPPAPLRAAATVVFHPAFEACPCPPTSPPLRWLQGPGGCGAFRGLILALASRAGSAPSAPPLHRAPAPGRAIEPSAPRGRLGGAPGGEWSRGPRCTLFPAGWARGCRGCSLHCPHRAEFAGGPPRPARQTWRAPGAHGGSGEGAGQPRGRRLARAPPTA